MDLEVEGGVLTQIRPAQPEVKPDLGGDDLWAAPSLIDLQLNGFRGIDLNVPEITADHIVELVETVATTGVVQFCPTVVTGPIERLIASCRAIAEARRHARVAESVLAVHLEGPYLSPEEGPRGAHPPEYIHPPDWEEFSRLQEAAEGLIRLVTVAPEVPGAIPFIEKLVSQGIKVAIGHSALTAKDLREAIAAGVTLSTHLGNGCHAKIDRHHNYIWEQLAADELTATLIVDGHHLPPSVVKCMLRCKGLDRSVLISDAIAAAGLPPGQYVQNEGLIEVDENLRVSFPGTPYLAGSALVLLRGVENAMSFAGLTLSEALQLATLNPARAMSLEHQVGQLAVGKRANLMLFRYQPNPPRLELRYVLAAGQPVYRS